MVWLAYLGLSGSILFAISCAVMLLGAPPKVVVELAVSTSSVMLAAAMLVNFCAVALRRRAGELSTEQSPILVLPAPPVRKHEDKPVPEQKSPHNRFVAHLPRSGPQSRPIDKASVPPSGRGPAKRALPPTVVLQAARQPTGRKASRETMAG